MWNTKEWRMEYNTKEWSKKRANVRSDLMKLTLYAKSLVMSGSVTVIASIGVASWPDVLSDITFEALKSEVSRIRSLKFGFASFGGLSFSSSTVTSTVPVPGTRNFCCWRIRKLYKKLLLLFKKKIVQKLVGVEVDFFLQKVIALEIQEKLPKVVVFEVQYFYENVFQMAL